MRGRGGAMGASEPISYTRGRPSTGAFLTHSPAGVYRSLLFSLSFRATEFPMSTFLCRWILHTNLHALLLLKIETLGYVTSQAVAGGLLAQT